MNKPRFNLQNLVPKAMKEQLSKLKLNEDKQKEERREDNTLIQSKNKFQKQKGTHQTN